MICCTQPANDWCTGCGADFIPQLVRYVGKPQQ